VKWEAASKILAALEHGPKDIPAAQNITCGNCAIDVKHRAGFSLPLACRDMVQFSVSAAQVTTRQKCAQEPNPI